MKKQNEKQNISGEETTIMNSPVQGAASSGSKPSTKPGKGGNAWKSVLVGGIPGIVFGVAGTFAAEGMAAAAPIPDENDIETPNGSAPVYETAHEATGVNDDMSFNDAFAAARAEVGAGGVFSWHGQVYSTYLKQEWDELSDDQRHDFSNSVLKANVHPDPYTPQPNTSAGDDPQNGGDDPQNGEDGTQNGGDDPQNGEDVHIIGNPPEDGIDNSEPFINVDADGRVILDPDDVGLDDSADNLHDGYNTDLDSDDVGLDSPEDNLYDDMPDYTNDADASSLI